MPECEPIQGLVLDKESLDAVANKEKAYFWGCSCGGDFDRCDFKYIHQKQRSTGFIQHNSD